MDKYYFYNGFGKPKEIDIDNLVLSSNYMGDITDEFIEEHHLYKDEEDKVYNEQLGYYGVYRNPVKEDFEEKNSMYGLDKDAYMEDFKV